MIEIAAVVPPSAGRDSFAMTASIQHPINYALYLILYLKVDARCQEIQPFAEKFLIQN
jgi:hypothetical protein